MMATTPPKPLDNASYRILGIANRRGVVTAHDIFSALYKTSKQPGKKCAGLYRHLRRMTVRGWMKCVARNPGAKLTAEKYVATAEGIRAGLERQAEDEGRAKPAWPRLAR